jgi:hypothetical protein
MELKRWCEPPAPGGGVISEIIRTGIVREGIRANRDIREDDFDVSKADPTAQPHAKRLAGCFLGSEKGRVEPMRNCRGFGVLYFRPGKEAREETLARVCALYAPDRDYIYSC